MIVRSDFQHRHKSTKPLSKKSWVYDEKESLDVTLIGSLLIQKRNVLVSGKAGSGKSHLLREIYRLTSDKFHTMVISYTGISCVNLGDFAQTIHSTFCIKPQDRLSPYNIAKVARHLLESRSEYAKRQMCKIRKMKLLIIDEISMVPAHFFSFIDYILQNAKHNREPFGGIMVLSLGDFTQIPPITIHKKAYVFHERVWDELNITRVFLDRCYRSDCKVLDNVVDQLRWGKFDESVLTFCQDRTIDSSYESLEAKFANALLLSCRRQFCFEYNIFRLSKLKGEIKHYIADPRYSNPNNEGKNHEPIHWQDDVMLHKNFPVPPKLALAEDCQVMCLCNKWREKGVVNGTVLKVNRLGENCVYCVTEKGEEIKITRHTFFFNIKGMRYSMYQLPLTLAYACTIQKCQGLTLPKVVIDMRKINICLLYVAVSRVKKASDVHFIHTPVETCALESKEGHEGLMYEKYPYQVQYKYDVEIKEDIDVYRTNKKLPLHRRLFNIRKRAFSKSLPNPRPRKKKKV